MMCEFVAGREWVVGCRRFELVLGVAQVGLGFEIFRLGLGTLLARRTIG